MTSRHVGRPTSFFSAGRYVAFYPFVEQDGRECWLLHRAGETMRAQFINRFALTNTLASV